MNADQILDMIGDARGEYILQAQQHRAGTAPQSVHRPRRMLLAAALIALMLLLVGCTLAYASGWFVSYFQRKALAPLTDEQIRYIEENEQIIGHTQTQGDWTVELFSAITDGTKGYIILGITAPEDVNLTPRVKDDVMLDWFGPGNSGTDVWYGPPVIQGSEGVYWSTLSSTWLDDGDGKDNTRHYALEITPNRNDSTLDPFGPDAVYHITIQNIVREYDDEEYKQHLLDTKYAGQTDVMFTHEETQRMNLREVLTDGTWEFDVTFSGGSSQPFEELEFLSGPIRTEADILRRYGEQLWESAHFREEVTVTSALLRPLGLTLTYEDCNGGPTFYFSDEDLFAEADIFAYAVMQDGSRIRLWDMGKGGTDYKVLDAESPVVIDSVDHILLADSTKLYPDGTVAYPPKAQPPKAASAFTDIRSESGVYAHYGDFDGDRIDDMALWYDGSFRKLCLLDAQGEARCTIPLEAGTDVYETYNQRAAEIRYEPNLVKTLHTEDGLSILRFFRATEEGLQLRESLKQEGDAFYQAIGDGEWKQISEETYQRARDDHQVMSYRLYPIA